MEVADVSGLAALVAREALLFAAIGFLIGGIDDFVVDQLWLWRHGLRRLTVYRRHARATAADFPEPSRRFALFVAAWDEGAVIAPMLRTLLARNRYPGLTVFVGCYANDAATLKAVAAVAREDSRVRISINPRFGPTTKADNLNAMWQDLQQVEAVRRERFFAVVFHDAEDVVAAEELRVFDHLLDRAEVVQLPVVPLVDRGSRWVSGHYMDEFAIAHAKVMVVREALGAALPLAGTGFAVRRDVIAGLSARRGGRPFDDDSLTEDYELGLSLGAAGARSMMVRLRARPGGPLIAVRAHFPATFGAAVRQKARWMVGIALAGWDRVGWSRWQDRGWRENWMRLRDRRGLMAALLLAAGYAGAAAWLIAAGSAMVVGQAVPPLHLPAWLIIANAALMAWRLVLRAVIVGEAYGWREALRSAPRVVIANLITIVAAWRAVTRYTAMMRGERTRWDKTAHVFPEVPA